MMILSCGWETLSSSSARDPILEVTFQLAYPDCADNTGVLFYSWTPGKVRLQREKDDLQRRMEAPVVWWVVSQDITPESVFWLVGGLEHEF